MEIFADIHFFKKGLRTLTLVSLCDHLVYIPSCPKLLVYDEML